MYRYHLVRMSWHSRRRKADDGVAGDLLWTNDCVAKHRVGAVPPFDSIHKITCYGMQTCSEIFRKGSLEPKCRLRQIHCRACAA